MIIKYIFWIFIIWNVFYYFSLLVLYIFLTFIFYALLNYFFFQNFLISLFFLTFSNIYIYMLLTLFVVKSYMILKEYVCKITVYLIKELERFHKHAYLGNVFIISSLFSISYSGLMLFLSISCYLNIFLHNNFSSWPFLLIVFLPFFIVFLLNISDA